VRGLHHFAPAVLVYFLSFFHHFLRPGSLDPTDKKLFGAMKAALAVMGKDEYCLEFIEAYRADRIA